MCFEPQRRALFLALDLEMCFAPQRRALFLALDLEMCFAPQRRALFRRPNFQKWSEPHVALYILTWKCASRHNGARFFDISTSKSVPKPRCFVHFDLDMCFAPQRRAIFHFLSGQLAPHLPLEQAYFSTLQSHKSLETHSESRLSASSFFSLLFFSDLLTSFLLLLGSSHLCFSMCPYCRKFDF